MPGSYGTKLTALTELTAPSDDDIVYVVDAPGGTPLSRKATIANLRQSIMAFPATQVASADANTLDDYEEGNWTPSIAFGGAAVGVTYSLQLGAYVKIARSVFLTCIVVLTAKGTSVGAATITGLPFANLSGNNRFIAAMSFRVGGAVTYANMMQGYVDTGGSAFILEEVTEAGVVTALANTDFVDTSNLSMSAHYYAT